MQLESKRKLKYSYTYIKEIVGGNSIIVLSEEEKEALAMAMVSNTVPR